MDDKVLGIEGYVKNDGREAYFKLQRPLPPGAKISFQSAYLSVGKLSKKKGHDFIHWLKETYFSSPEWGFYDKEGNPYFDSLKEPEPETLEVVIKEEVIEDKPKKRKTTRAKTVRKTKSANKEKAETKETSPAKGAGKIMRRSSQRQKSKGVEITAESMVTPDFPQAKLIIDDCRSRSELKKALNLSRHVSRKEEHMRYIHNRLQQV